MRAYFIILTFFISASTFDQKQNQKLTISQLTKDFHIYTTFGDARNGYMYPANRMYLCRDKGIALFIHLGTYQSFISGRTDGQIPNFKKPRMLATNLKTDNLK